MLIQISVEKGVVEWAHGRAISRGRSTFMSGALMHDCIKDKHIFQRAHIPTSARKNELRNVELCVRITTCKEKEITRKDGYMQE